MLRFCLYFLCRGVSTTSIHKRPCKEHQGIAEGTTGRQERAGHLSAGQGGSVLPISSPGNDGNWKSAFPSPWLGMDAAQDCHEDQLIKSNVPRQAETWTMQRCAVCGDWNGSEGFSLGSCFSESQTEVSSRAHSTICTAQEPAWITNTVQEIKTGGRGGSGCSLPRRDLAPLHLFAKGRD